MYSERTQDQILQDMKNATREDVDKREGSIVHDMLAPSAYEIEMLGFELDAILELGFADTSQAEFLERRTAELGIFRKVAIGSDGVVTFVGLDGTEIPIGTRLLTESGIVFATAEYAVVKDGAATVPVEAVTLGIAGNIGPGEIVQIENRPAGLDSVSNVGAFIGGVDIESDDELKARYLLKVRKPITSGNKYHYELWATEVEGVSAARVHPLWNGNGTVKVVIVDTEGRAPAPDIVAATAAHIEEQRPIGATVTVVAVTEVLVDIAVTLTLAGDLLPEDVQDAIVRSLDAYLVDAGELVRYSHVANAIIDTEGVVDYEGLTLNGGTANVPIDSDSVAVAGAVTLHAAN